ncbi:MAG: hypothetical protein MJ099_01360 [Clostridia bacterium]|nr:hypothetical protein [Clostridia bacterium]
MEALIAKIDALLEALPYVRIAIDGNAAAGKTTLGERIAEHYGAALIHMDDYFVPFARKTPERMAEPGGNVDYERFKIEVCDVPRGEGLQIRPFDCAAQQLKPAILIPAARLTVIEGSYSHHPYFGEHVDLRVFMKVAPEVQIARVLRRNGPEKLQRFIDTWIPLENRYFEHFGIETKADIVIDTSR